MIHAQNNKLVYSGLLTVTNGGTTKFDIDTYDFNYADIKLHLTIGTAAGTAKPGVFQISEGTAITGAFTAISGLVGTTNTTASTSQFTMVASGSNTNTGPTYRFMLPLARRQRYLRVEFTGATGALTLDGIAELSRGTGPQAAADDGVDQKVIVG